MRLIVLAAMAALLPAQELPDWVLQLSRAKRHARANFEHLPNYACRETVDRSEKARGERTFRKLDRLQLEVALVDGRELFAKAGGAFRFDRPIDLIATGTFGTGTFSAIVRNLFIHDAARSDGWADEHDRLRFGYVIPQSMSPLRLEVWSHEAVVGERGSFWVDAKSLDLLEAKESATDIPPDFPLTSVQTNVRYAKVKIGASERVLPIDAETLVEDAKGLLSRNAITFSGCREFGSESKITFDKP